MATWMVVLAVLSAAPRDDFDCTWQRETWTGGGAPAPCLVKDFEQEWSLTAEQAACAREAQGTPKKGQDDMYPGHAAWRSCVARWPTQPLLWRAFVATWDHRDAESLALIRTAPATRVDGGLSIAEQLLGLKFAPTGVLALRIVDVDPTRLPALLVDERLHSQDRFVLALQLLDRRAPVGTEWNALAPALLEFPLEQNLPMLAAELWLRLPDALRAELAKKPEKLPLTSYRKSSLRPLLALGLVALGKKDEAKRFVFGRNDDARGGRGENEALFKEAVGWHLTGTRPRNAWDCAIDAVDVDGWEVWVGLMPFLRPHEALFLERFARLEAWEKEEHRSRWEGLAPDVVDRIEASQARALKLLKQQVPFEAKGRDVPREEVEGVAPPALSVFSEKTSSWKGKVTKQAPESRQGGFWPLVSQRVGGQTVTLALSQRLDPVGEVGPGAYWLLITKGTGATQQVYLGLGDHRPFHALESTEVPLLDDKGVVRLTMEDAPLVERTITFPPVALQAPTKRAKVVLEAPLADLVKDTDGDGLSDLVEQRLLLDPAKPDTDGDGIKDGDDATPRLDDRLPLTPLATMYNAFFEHFSERRQPRALITKPGKDPMAVVERKADLEDVRYLEGTPEQLGGLRPLNRVVTLSPEEYARAKATYGAFYPMSVKVFLNGNGNDHAYVVWSERWRGGSMRIDRQPSGELVVTDLGSWIT